MRIQLQVSVDTVRLGISVVLSPESELAYVALYGCGLGSLVVAGRAIFVTTLRLCVHS